MAEVMEKTATVTEGTGAAAGATPAQGTEKEPKGTEEAKGKLYDQEYIDQLLAQQKEAQDAAVAEALKVAAMDADKKAAYVREQEEKKQAQREAELSRRELLADAREILEEKDVPREFLEMLVGQDRKETEKNVDAFKAAFSTAVQAQVEKRMAGKTPQGGNGSTGSEAAAIAAEIDKYMYTN